MLKVIDSQSFRGVTIGLIAWQKPDETVLEYQIQRAPFGEGEVLKRMPREYPRSARKYFEIKARKILVLLASRKH